MRNYIRIEMNGNDTRLVYQRGLIQEYSQNLQSIRARAWQGKLEIAYNQLKENIRDARELNRDADKLAYRSRSHILNLLREKRRVKARESFQAKKPANRSKHVGVEIEFLSKSNREEIALTLAENNLTQFVELKSDGSVRGEGAGDDCDGSCRENCECSDCGESHYCDNETECNRRHRNYEGSGTNEHWEYREDCRDCRRDGNFESLEDCDCGGTDAGNNPVCLGEHVLCVGHCDGHYCNGYDDHPDYECNCECDCSSEYGHEIAVVAKSSHIAEVITKVCAVLSEHDAEVNKTCGLHVHLDMRGSDENRAFSNLVKAQNLLYGMVPHSRYENTYCRPNKSRCMDDYQGRYFGINPQSYKEHRTIEVRLHSGSINAVKIINWIKLLQKIAYCKKKIPVKVKKATDITNALTLSDSLKNYISERINNFDNKLIINDINVELNNVELNNAA